jgi:NADH-quinone oxidoreductase subunit J
MSAEQIIFLIVAVISLGAGLIHAALWLIVTLFGVAILYVLLEAGFFAVVQVVIYIGAIAILFIFAAMLTRRVMKDSGPQTNSYWWLAAPVAVILFGGLVWMMNRWSGFTTELPAIPSDVKSGLLSKLGKALVSTDGYVLPFEMASILLVAAFIGAIWVARERK